MKRTLILIALTAVLCAGPTIAQSPSTLTFEARVEAQRAIEGVYWQQRLWPGSDAKPTLDEIMPTSVIEAKVTDYLKKSAALEQLWQRPISQQMLQAELDRMVRSSKAPDTLRSLFAALGNDGYLIAETLVRQKLADRIVRERFGEDTQLHADVLQRARQALSDSNSIEDWISQGAEHSVSTIALSDDANEIEQPSSEATYVDQEHWDYVTKSLSKRLGNDLPIGHWSELSDLRTAFEVIRIQRSTDETLTVERVSWPKQSFDLWWDGMSSELVADEGGAPVGYTMGDPDEACTSGEWSPLPTVPQGRSGHVAVWTGSEMIIWSGGISTYYGGRGFDTGGLYDPATDSWQATTKTGAPIIRVQYSAVWSGSEMLVWGGRDGHEFGSSINTGGRYDPISNSWQSMSNLNAPDAREEHTAIWSGSEMIVWGGFDHVEATLTDSFLSTGGRYDPVSDSWTALSNSGAPSARSRHSVIWTGSKMIVWGGWDGPSSFGDGASYDPLSDSWTAVSAASAPGARSRHSAVWTGSEMLVWGGTGLSTVLQDGGRYSPGSDSWSAMSNLSAPNKRRQHTAVWTGSEMIVWGGNDGTNELSSGGQYDPLSDSWSATSAGPASRTAHSAIWTGSEMIVWGGSDETALGVDYLQSGSRYDPASDSWNSTFSANTPTRRAWHTALWTGAEMIVWGGSHYGYAYLDSGGCYDPATDSWTETVTASAPPGRVHHSATWTGTEMIIWGGYEVNQSIGLNYWKSGGRYNLATGKWAPTSMDNAAAKRAKHTAVWTGSEMIVWGGAGHSGLSAYGKIYNPATDSWRDHTHVDEPEKRYWHTAVWTGTEMIVWGGGGEGYPRDANHRYNPVTDEWNTISNVGQPIPTLRHTSVWTGSKMIVWGGDAAMTIVSSGGIYDPTADSWTLTSMVDAPPARQRGSAVWTGSNMIVWGGKGMGYLDLDSGGVYNPTANSWSPTSLDQVPTARWDHTGVWDGSEMLIFGGESDNYTFMADGGRLCALDGDLDGQLDQLDCDATNSSTWTEPGEIGMLSLAGSGMTEISWSAPTNPGSTSLTYDVLRADGPDGFMSPMCVVSDTTSTSAGDPSPPAANSAFYYLVVAKNGCGTSLGSGSDGSPRSVLTCP